jgi:hypothetical protein
VLPAALLFMLKDYAIVSGDSRPVVLTASSLVSEGDWELSEFAGIYSESHLFAGEGQVPYFLQQTSTGTHSGYPLGMVPFVLPAAVVARLSGADMDDPKVHARLEKWTAAWVAAASLGLFFLLALHLAPARPAWVVTLILATGSALLTTVGQALWQHGGVIFWLLLALLVEFRCRGRPGRAGAMLQGIAMAMMLACRLSSALIVGAFGAWLLLRSPKRFVSLAVFSGLAYVPWAFLYQSIYGTMFGPSSVQMDGAFWSFTAQSLAGILVSPSRGVLVYQPWILLLGLVLIPSFRRRLADFHPQPSPTGWAILCVCVIVLHLALICTWKCWWGGYCWGSRLAAEVIPLAAILCLRPVGVLWLTVGGRRLVVSLAFVSCLMHVPAVYLRSADWHGKADPVHHPETLWSWSAPPFLYPLVR